MNWLARILDFLFLGIIHRQRQQTRAAYALALATWRRHDMGKNPEGPGSMAEAAQFIIEEDMRTGMSNWQTKQASALLGGLYDTTDS